MTQSINQSVNDEADCRTAPATPGLLIMLGELFTINVENGKRMMDNKVMMMHDC